MPSAAPPGLWSRDATRPTGLRPWLPSLAPIGASGTGRRAGGSPAVTISSSPDGMCIVPDGMCVIPGGMCVIPDDMCIVPDDMCIIPDDICVVPDDVCVVPPRTYKIMPFWRTKAPCANGRHASHELGLAGLRGSARAEARGSRLARNRAQSFSILLAAVYPAVASWAIHRRPSGWATNLRGNQHE